MKKKNKWLIGIGAVVVLGFMFSDSEEEVQPKEKAEPKTEQVEAKPRNKEAENPRDKAEEKPKEKTAEEKAAEEEVAAELKRLDEIQIYLDNVNVPLDKLHAGTTKFGDQSTKLASNNSLMFNEEWILDTVVSIVEIDAAANELKTVQPTNEQTKAIQDLFNQIADHWIYIADNYPTAIDNRDAALMQKIGDEIVAATGKLKEADSLIVNLTADSIFFE